MKKYFTGKHMDLQKMINIDMVGGKVFNGRVLTVVPVILSVIHWRVVPG